MFYRTVEIFEDTAMGASGTEIIDIDVANPISQIVIQQRSTGDGNTITAHLAEVIDKIEIVDGSNVLYSLDGYEAKAFDFYHRKKEPLDTCKYLNNVQGIMIYVLNFGRYLWDEVLALDPTKFTNPQLKITYDRDGGGNASDLLEIQVVAHLFDEKVVSPVGFLMHKEIKKYTLSSQAWEDTDLPTDFPYRMLMVQSLSAGKHPHSQFREMKLSEDTDRKIPFDFLTMNLIKFMQVEFPGYEEDYYGVNTVAGTAQNIFVTPAYFAKFVAIGERDSAGDVSANEGHGGTVSVIKATAGNMIGTVRGFCPHGAVVVPFGKPMELDDWYDVSKIGSLKLKLKGGTSPGSNSTAQICLQQLRKY